MAFQVNRDTTATFTGTLTDASGTVVPSASLTALTLTLYDLNTRSVASGYGIINNRNLQNVLNANNVTVNAQGVVTFSMVVADNPCIGTQPQERHRMVWRWSTSTEVGSATIDVDVINTN